MRSFALFTAFAGSLSFAATLHAQQPVGKLEGTITEKIGTRSVAAAEVALVQLDRDRSPTFSARPDARGRYRLDSLPAGRYLVQVSSPTLDSLDLALPASELSIVGGRTARADFTLPFGAALREIVCPGVKLDSGKVIVAGRATDPDTDRPIAGADIVAAWTEVSIDKTTIKASLERRKAVVTTGPLGEYRLCGVPSGRWLWVQLQYAGRAGAVSRFSVSEDEGAVVRDISMSARSAPTIAALDSLERVAQSASSSDSTGEGLQLTGTAILTGTVRMESGQPLAGVRVRVRDAQSSAVTDDAGRFVLSGLPSATQVMLVRHLGYAVAEIPVELRPGRSVKQDVRLTRAAVLDSVRVTASRRVDADFERVRRTNPAGKFMALGEIQRRAATETGDLLLSMGGFRVVGRGQSAKIFSKVATSAKPLCGEANVVMEGVEGLSINDIDPSTIAGIAAYPDGSGAPPRYERNADCGLIVIWLRPKNNGRPGIMKGLGYNGY
jgi:hypothetical protein